MSKNIHSLIRSEYEKKQQMAYDSLMSRKNEVYSRAPGIQEIDRQIQFSGIEYNKMILLGGSPADKTANELVSEIDGLKKKRGALLAASGYPSNYLDIIYKCPRCKDTGFVDGDSGSEKCACYKQQLIYYLFSRSNLNLARKENFSTFDESCYPDDVDEKKYGMDISPRENIINIKERCLKFIGNFTDPEEKNLFFSGPAGVGKTFMSNCIAMEIMNMGRTVLYQTAPLLFDTISEYKMKAFKEEEYEDSGYRNIFEAELLIIDDLGTESPSAARYAELLNILNTRQLNNFAKPCKTIISTNIGARQLFDYYTERVGSRIKGCFDRLIFAGEDIRSVKA